MVMGSQIRKVDLFFKKLNKILMAAIIKYI
jgi:hypothetical protein